MASDDLAEEFLPKSFPTTRENFTHLEYYYDSSARKILVYLDTNSSALAWRSIRVKKQKVKSSTVYRITIFSSLGGKDASVFKNCLDGGQIVSFAVKSFDRHSDRVLYEDPNGGIGGVRFGGDGRTALSKHELRPRNWSPPQIKGIPGISK